MGGGDGGGAGVGWVGGVVGGLGRAGVGGGGGEWVGVMWGSPSPRASSEEYYPTWARRSLLRRGFNFHCRCARCRGQASYGVRNSPLVFSVLLNMASRFFSFFACPFFLEGVLFVCFFQAKLTFRRVRFSGFFPFPPAKACFPFFPPSPPPPISPLDQHTTRFPPGEVRCEDPGQEVTCCFVCPQCQAGARVCGSSSLRRFGLVVER